MLLFTSTVAAFGFSGAGLFAVEKPWGTDPERALQTAAQSGRPVFMQFSASWCAICKRLERTTLADPEVSERIARDYVPVRVDADRHRDLVKDLEIKGLPAILIVSPDLEILHRIAGFQTSEALLTELDEADRAAARPKAKRTVETRGDRGDSEATSERPEVRRTPARSATRTRSGEELESEPESRVSSVSRPKTQPKSKPAAAPATRRNIEELPDDFLRMVEEEKTRTRSTGELAERARESDAGDEESERSAVRSRAAEPQARSVSRKAAFDGASLVSAVDDRVIEAGSSRYQTTFRGQTLYFRSEHQRRAFEDDPERYWPALDGICPLTLLRTDRRETGRLEHAAVFRGQVWLFSTEEDMQEFVSSPSAVIEDVRAMTGE